MNGSSSTCSEGCAGFHPLPGDPWSDFGICRLPDSPQRGFPVKLGSTCAHFTPRDSSRDAPLQPENAALANPADVISSDA